MAQSPYVFEVAENQFDEAILERSRTAPVVVDFWAPWCGPCRMLGPILERQVQERNGEVLLAKVNIDEAQRVAARYGVEAIPHVVAFRDGQPVLDFVGLISEPQLREFLNRLVPSEADRLTRDGLVLENTNPAEAEKLLRQALAKDGKQEDAILGLVRLLIAQDKDAEARELIENLGAYSKHGDEVERLNGILGLRELARSCGSEDEVRRRAEKSPDDPQAQFELGCLLAAEGKYQDALEKLLAAGQRNRQLAETRVREAMVSIFNVIGARSPLADEYRSKLSLLLY